MYGMENHVATKVTIATTEQWCRRRSQGPTMRNAKDIKVDISWVLGKFLFFHFLHFICFLERFLYAKESRHVNTMTAATTKNVQQGTKKAQEMSTMSLGL